MQDGDLAGYAHPDFAEVAEILAKQVADAGFGGAAASVHHRGESVVDVWCGARDAAGTPWERDTVAMSFSTTKGVTATALHVCADRGLVAYDDRVADHWPRFAANGKQDITVRQVLSHEAGLFPIRSHIEHAGVMGDWEAMVAAIEEMSPRHEPGTENGYHGLTFGFLVGEIVRRVSGKPISDFVRDEIAAPLDLDGLYIGLPESEAGRLAELLPTPGVVLSPTAAASPGGVMAALAEALGVTPDPDLILEALAPRGMQDWMVSPEAPRAVVPAATGCFTARSLSKMYAALAAGGTLGSTRLLSPETVAEATRPHNSRPDLVLVFPMQWRLGYHFVYTTAGILPNAFGHFGFGGSGAWADPDRDLAVALTVNRVAGSAVGDTRVADIGGAAIRAVG